MMQSAASCPQHRLALASFRQGRRRSLPSTGRRLRLVLGLAVAFGLLGPLLAFAAGPHHHITAARSTRVGCRAEGLVGRDGEDALWVPNQRLVETIEKLGGRVTKADVLERGVAAAGLERELLQIARASGAGLEVNTKGELLFNFPKDLSAVLSSKNLAAQAQQVVQTVGPWVSYGGRILFGVSLLATVAILYSAVLVLLTANVSEKQDSRGNRQTFVSQNSFSLWFGEDLFWWLTPRPYGYYNYYGGGYGGYLWGLPEQPPPKLSFFESVFSFVFGDGDPNEKLLGETRWQLIGETIAQSGGSVIAEQLAPYLDPPSKDLSPEDEQKAVDKAMLPVLLRFKGRPEVTPNGSIVYIFPELQESRAAGELIVGNLSAKEMKQRLAAMGRTTTAVERSEIIEDYRRALQDIRAKSKSAPAFLQEREQKFSEADEGQIGACIAYGAFALLATLFFGSQILTGKALILARYYPVVGLLTNGFPWLLGYTAAFLGIPAWRYSKLEATNLEIQARNNWRAQQAEKLKRQSSWLVQRLQEAAQWAMGRRSFGSSVYNSAEDASKREQKSAAEDLKAFDQLLDRPR